MARRYGAPSAAALLSFLVSALLALAPRSSAQCAPAIEFGMNPSFHTWSSRAIVFADAAMRVREYSFWQNGAPAGRAPLIPLGRGLLGEGWPDPAALGSFTRFGAYLFGSMEGTVPDGRARPYVVTWKGAGAVKLEGPNVTGERAREAQRVEVFVDPTRGNGNNVLSLSWSTADARDPVRDVRVWLPGMELADELFWPPFLAKVRALNAGAGPHTWRTLDWTRVNEYGRPASHTGFTFDLAGMVTPRSASQGTFRGVCPEFQVALCNALGADLHFQVPHRTADLSEADYVLFLTRTLTALRDGSPGVPGFLGGRRFEALAPGRTVTLELSNEIWNSIFPVNGWMRAEAQRKGIGFHDQVASQIQLVFDVARTVFSGPDAARLRTYVGGFAGDPSYLERVLARLAPGTRVDAAGPAAYAGPRRTDMDAWLAGSSASACPNCPDAPGLLAAARRSIQSLRPQIASHRAIVDAYRNPDGTHPALELYEGGLNLKSAGEPWAAAARALQPDPELFDLFVDEYVPMLVDEGVELVNWYSFMSDQDAPSVDAYGMWNDMAQAIDLPVARPYADQGAPKAAVVCFGPPLAATCVPARATLRTAVGNADSFRATPPVLGGFFEATVDLASTGHPSAFVVYSLTPTSIPLPSGGTVLAAVNGAEFLPLQSGPLARWRVPIANDPALAGLTITTQAYHVGGRTGIALSNAMDLVFGR